MSKLVDKERLAKLAKALDARAKAAVAAEKERALAAEQAIEAKADANAAAITTINNAETGLLAQAKTYADGVANTEKERAEKEEGLLSGRIETLEGIIGGNAEGALGEVISNVADNAKAIAKLNGGAEEEGSVAKAVADAVKVEKDRAEGVEAGFETRIAATEKFVAAQPAKDEKQDQRLALLEEMMGLGGETGDKTAIEELQESITSLKTELQAEIDSDVSVETNRATAKEAELDAAIKAEAQTARAAEKVVSDEIAKQKDADQAGTLANKIAANATAIEKEATDRAAADSALAGRLNVIEGTGEGSVKKALQDAKDYADEKIQEVNGAAEGLGERVEANEAKLTGLEKATVKAEIEAAQAAAEKHADDAITALVDSAPEAMNTLNELAKAIKDNKDIYDGYIAEHATTMASMKADLQKEIDDDVAAEKALRVAEEAKIRGEFAAADTALHTTISAEIDADVKVEKERAMAQEAAIRQELANEKAALQAEIDADVKVVADELTKQKDAKQEGTLAHQIAQEVARATAEEAEIRTEFAAADATLQTNINKKVDQSAYNTKVAAIEKAIKDNTDAIAQEAKDRADAIAEALEAYSTTAEMKAILGNVVNSLALTMENNKMMLKLGGVDGITIHETSLDMATDDDIDAIIAGLDK